jgi:2-hydroxy-6-oxonona-2,4-dienedioate hydrolase
VDEERYRRAERRLWDDAGAAPSDRRVHLPRNDVEVRVQEVGEGPPVLFLHGGPGADGSIWAHLAARLPGMRCLLLDRPGTGLSAAHRPADAAAVRREAETLVPDALDALGIERAHLVGSSHGGYAALLAGALHPDRVARTAILGCPAFIDGMVVTAVDRLALLPGARRLFSLARPSEKGFRKVMRQLGHGRSLDVGRIPEAVIQWGVALQRHTDTMRNEFDAMSVMGTFRGGFDAALAVGPETLAGVRSPTLVLWGADEVYGDTGVARRLVEVLPAAELEVLPDAGHLCWFDDLDHAASAVRRHLLAALGTTAGTATG